MNNSLLFKEHLVLIKGAGDLASGVAYRLKRSGFPVVMTELATPTFVRRTVCFGEAIYAGQITVEGLVAQRVEDATAAHSLATTKVIPIIVDPAATAIASLSPTIVVDAIMAKVNTGTHITDANLVIGLGPGFTAGQDCHAVIETNRGHCLGRVIREGTAEPNTKTPGPVKGFTADRVLRAPAAGHVEPLVEIGQRVEAGQPLATVAGQPLIAPFSGVLRGLVHPTVSVTPGLKIGDLDPRGVVEHCFTISDKSLAIGGGVLEAVLVGMTE